MQIKERLKSWPLWTAIASLVVCIVLKSTGVDLSDTVTKLLALLLPVLVAFGIINNPTIRDRMLGDGDQHWYQSWVVWTSIAALIIYCLREFFGIDIEETVNKILDILLPILTAFGIVNNPTSKKSF